MNLPSLLKQFLDLLKTYDEAVWPAHVVAYGLGLLAVTAIFWARTKRNRFISGILALFWVWMGVVYCFSYNGDVNLTTRALGWLCIVQGAIFFILGVSREHLVFWFSPGARALVGICLIVYGMVFYPILGMLMGHSQAPIPFFGAAPSPMIAFSLGMLLLCWNAVPFYVLVIPLLWSLLGSELVTSLHLQQDYGLTIAGLVAVVMVLLHNREIKTVAGHSSRC